MKGETAEALNMKFARHVVAFILIYLASSLSSHAQAGENWWVGVERVSALDIPAKIAEADAVQVDLGYMNEKPGKFMGARRNLNNDGKPEYILRSTEVLCGSGGCPFAIFDGATLGFKGMFFGNTLAETGSVTAGWKVLETFTTAGAGIVNYDVFVMSGTKYKSVAQLTIEPGKWPWENRLSKNANEKP